MGGSPQGDGGLRVSEEEWRAVLAVAQDLAEKVSRLSGRLAVVERRLDSGDWQGFVRLRPCDR
jgi:hypothetical protein